MDGENEKQRLFLEDANNTGLQQQLKTIEDFLDEQQEAVTEYEEALVRKLISKIMEHPIDDSGEKTVIYNVVMNKIYQRIGG